MADWLKNIHLLKIYDLITIPISCQVIYVSASAAVSYTNVLLESGSFIYRVQQLKTSKMKKFHFAFFCCVKVSYF